MDSILKFVNQKPSQDLSPTSFDIMFIYVKNYCHYSRDAASLASKKCGKVYVFDVLTKRFVSPQNFHQGIDPNFDNTSFMDEYNKHYDGMSVPQVFGHATVQNKWYYIGGCSDLQSIESKINVKL